MASLAGKTVDFDHVILVPGPTDSWGSLKYSWFLPLCLRMADINSLIHPLDQYYSCSVIITVAVLRQIDIRL